MTKHQFQLEGKEVTSLVMSKEEFTELCTLLEKVKLKGAKPKDWKQQIIAIRNAEHLPLVSKGTETAFLFEKYGVETQLMTACIRGFATKGVVTVESQTAIAVIQKAYDELSEEIKKEITTTANEIYELLKSHTRQDEISNLITQFVFKHMKDVDRGLRLAFLEDVNKSVATTMVRRQMDIGDPFGPDFDGYLRRLLTGVVSTAEMFKKGQQSGSRN